MAETTDGYLSSLINYYTPSLTYFDKARGHRSSIQTRLDNWLGVIEMFETGSLRHGTGVWCYSDVDYIVSLKGTLNHTGFHAHSVTGVPPSWWPLAECSSGPRTPLGVCGRGGA